MNHDYFAKKGNLAGKNCWLVTIRDIRKDGHTYDYVTDIVYSEKEALDGVEESRQRHYLWDHYEAITMNQ